MQQAFHTRNYSIRDFEEWNKHGDLVLQPKFQRREVWSDKARSYLMDTILRGKPIPKIYMRQDINPETRRVRREIVDGQQRLHTVLTFIKDGFKISKAHHEEFGGKVFSDLSRDTQRDILKYEFVVDLLEDMKDNEIYDLFARINTYAEKLKNQELRNAQYFGDFKSSVYSLSKEFSTFFVENGIFTPKSILRMAEAEFVSDLLVAIHDGIQAGAKAVWDAAYKKYDDDFPGRRRHERRFREIMDAISGIFGETLAGSEFHAIRMFYPLFCSLYHLKYGLPKFRHSRKKFRPSDYPKISVALDGIAKLVTSIKEAEKEHEDIDLTTEERRFYEALTVRWVHAKKRITMTEYICKRLVKALSE
jgi:Protein of unknown function DUF262